MVEYKTAFQLEEMIADLAGLDTKNIQVTSLGKAGNFYATMIGTVSGVNRFRAQSDIDAACARLKANYKLKY
jgi:hypothetical protein